MSKADPRFIHVTKMVASQLGCTPALVDKGSKANYVDEFLAAGVDGVEPKMALIFFMSPDGSSVQMVSGEDSDTPLVGKCCYCVRLSDPFQPLPTKDLEDLLNFGTLSGATDSPMSTLMMMIKELYNPLIMKKSFAFQKKMTADNLDSLVTSTESFCGVLEKVRVAYRAHTTGNVFPAHHRADTGGGKLCTDARTGRERVAHRIGGTPRVAAAVPREAARGRRACFSSCPAVSPSAVVSDRHRPLSRPARASVAARRPSTRSTWR